MAEEPDAGIDLDVGAVDAQKGVVGKGETDAGGGELAGQPAMPVAIELEAERTPGTRR